MVARPLPERRACAAVVDGPRHSLPFAAAVGCALALTTIALVVGLWTAAPAQGAPGDVDWAKTWNADRPGVVSNAKVVAKPGGGLYVVASLLRPSGNIDIAVLRYSAQGKRSWVRYYDGAAHGLDWMEDVAVGHDGSLVVCGSTFTRSGKDDWVVLKYAPDGSRRWTRTVAGASGGPDVPEALAVAGNGDIVVAGTLTRKATGGDWCVIKFSARGVRLWRTTMTRSVSGLDQPLAVAIDPADANVYVTGRMYASQSGDDAVTVRYRANGRRIWRQRWDGDAGGPDRGAAIAVAGTGIAVAGVTDSPGTGNDGLVLRYAKNGTLRLEKVVDGGTGAAGIDAFTAVGIDDDGAVVAGGGVTTVAEQGEDAVVVRYLRGGAQAGWWQAAGAGAEETILDLVATGAGRTYAVGTTAGASSPDALIAGLSGALGPLWPAVTYDRAGGDDQAQSVSITSGAIYVTGVSGSDLYVARVAR
jgi:hypothetical protein